mgnify:FL=1
MPLILPGNVGSATAATGFNVANSARFNTASSDDLRRTFSSGDRKTWTWSSWIKRATLGANQSLFSCHTGDSDTAQLDLKFDAGDTISYEGKSTVLKTTSRVFRDVSAWYHIMFVLDMTQATASNRMKFYVNGVLETSFATDNTPARNTDLGINQNSQHVIGMKDRNTDAFFGGYLAETVFIDAAALAPTDFGEFDDSGIWKPIDPSGLTFGTNGFYLNFQTSAELGDDVSGNTNDFSETNLTAVDQSIDTCTNNFATMNILDNFFAGSTFSQGNLNVDMTTSGVETFNTSTIGVSSGKWYAEVLHPDASSKPMVGISHAIPIAIGNVLGNSGFGYAYMGEDGQVKAEGSNGAYGATYGNDDIIGIALDLDNNKLYFSKNGSFQNSGDPTTGSTGTGAVAITAAASTGTGTYFFAAGKRHSDNNEVSWNFGSPAHAISSGNTDANGFGNFEYAVPSGYFSLNTKNLAEYG